jgi:RNA polymerase sigma factor FliA
MATTTGRRRGGAEVTWRRDGAHDLWDAHRLHPTIGTRNRLVEWYYPLVRRLARRVGRKLWGQVEADDMIGPGAVGLMRAIDGYDEARGIKFETFATTRIVGEMRDELRRLDWRGRTVRARVKLIDEGREESTAVLGHDPTDEELSEYLGIGGEGFRRAVADAEFRVSSMQKKVGSSANGDRDILLHHVLPDVRTEPPDAGMARDDFRALACRDLTPRQREIVGGYYFEGLTMKQISRRLGITESRVCQIHIELIEQIRECFANRSISYIA